MGSVQTGLSELPLDAQIFGVNSGLPALSSQCIGAIKDQCTQKTDSCPMCLFPPRAQGNLFDFQGKLNIGIVFQMSKTWPRVESKSRKTLTPGGPSVFPHCVHSSNEETEVL